MKTNATWTLPHEQLPSHVDPSEKLFQQLKASLHEELAASLDLSRLGTIDRQQLWQHVDALAEEACQEYPGILGSVERERLHEELMAEFFGLGPVEGLMHDPAVTDVLVNDPYTVYVERNGRLELTDVAFADEEHLMRIIQRIVARVGRRIDEFNPTVDARLPDGSRVHAIVPPLALDGPALSIRRFGIKPYDIHALIANESLPPAMVDFLAGAIESRIGILLSGGTGAGKTTLLNALSGFIPSGERLVTIEDSAELILQHRHRIRLETRPPNMEGAGEVTQRELVRNSLRMRPDRIIVGEVRGPEVWDMLQAMNTGHEGSLTTVHANSASDALARLEMMVAMTGFDIPLPVVRQYVASAIRLTVHVARLKGGLRRVMQISEIQGIHEGTYSMKDIFRFEQTGVSEEGMAQGYFQATGQLPECLERFRSFGVRIPDELFRERRLSFANVGTL